MRSLFSSSLGLLHVKFAALIAPSIIMLPTCKYIFFFYWFLYFIIFICLLYFWSFHVTTFTHEKKLKKKKNSKYGAVCLPLLLFLLLDRIGRSSWRMATYYLSTGIQCSAIWQSHRLCTEQHCASSTSAQFKPFLAASIFFRDRGGSRQLDIYHLS